MFCHSLNCCFHNSWYSSLLTVNYISNYKFRPKQIRPCKNTSSLSLTHPSGKLFCGAKPDACFLKIIFKVLYISWDSWNLQSSNNDSSLTSVWLQTYYHKKFFKRSNTLCSTAFIVGCKQFHSNLRCWNVMTYLKFFFKSSRVWPFGAEHSR